MKKLTLMALFCAAMMLPAAAQWNPGDKSLTKIAQESGIEFNSPAIIRKADGSTILVYRTFGIQTNPETQQKDTERQFYLYLQILDKDGNKKFDGNGKLISYKPTDTAAYGRPNVDTLSNGNIVITFADIRKVENDNYKEPDLGDNLGDHIKIKSCKIIAYCYDQEGNSVWSKDGVMMPYHVMDPTANCTFYAGEKLAVSGDKIYVAAAILEQFTKTDPHTLDPVDSYAHYFEIACLDYSGTILKEKHYETWQAFTYVIAAAPEGKCYFVYVDKNDHYSAQLLGPDLENTWADAKLIEPYGVVSHEGGAAIAFPPTDIIPISDGSIGLIYKAFMPNHFSQLYYNRIYSDGSTLNEHVLLSDTAGYDHDHVIMVEDDILNLAECVKYERADYGEYFLSLNRIKLDGTRLCPKYDGFLLDINRGVDPTPICIVHGDENYNVLTFEKDYLTKDYQSFCYSVSPDGKMFQRKPILRSVYIDDIANASESQYAYLIFGRDTYGAHGLWMSCIDGTDYTNSVELKGELPGKFSVNADGKQVQFSKADLQYLPARKTYFFAAHQMFVQDELNRWISETDLDFEDLFGWGTGNNPIETSTNDADYAAFTDWGNNAILNSTYEAGTWRTMTKDEWDYLLNGRPDAAQKRTIGQINMAGYAPVYGMFLLPDEFEMPSQLEMDMNAQEWDINTYGPDSLLRLENAGVVFLPNGGWREAVEIKDLIPTIYRGIHGYYWTATESGSDQAQILYIDKTGPSFDARPRHQGLNVRLVKDAGEPQGIKDVEASGNANNSITRKVLVDGVIYIVRDGKTYNALGTEVR